jgi:ABC-type branched-subunit amino acid transport system ATPase component
MPSSRTAALEAVGVVKRFGPVTALDGVSLVIAAGECVALIGESGFSTTAVVAIVLAAAAACALVAFGLMRRRTHPQAAKVSSLPGPATGQHTKAA